MKALAFAPAVPSKEAPSPADAQKAASPDVLRAAREFESIFLRTLLAPLEKTTKLGSSSGLAAGQSAFGGMVVSAMADSVSSVGGIGLADVVARALSAKASSSSGNNK